MMNRIGLLLIGAFALAGCSEVPQSTGPAEAAKPAAATASATTAPARPAGVVTEWTSDLASMEKITLCSLDAVNSTSAENGAFMAPAGQPLVFDGWLATPDLKLPGDFSIVLAGKKSYAISASSGVTRDDVQRAYSAPALQTSGFHVEVASGALEPGDYQVTLVQKMGEQYVSCESPNRLQLR